MSSARLHIAVGVIFNSAGDKVLLAKRPDGAHQGGLWEFPGGKARPGEEIRQALQRELYEELHLIVDSANPLIVIEHDYPDLAVTLDVWSVAKWHGEVIGSEGQLIEWVSLDELPNREFPAANRALITAIHLPPLYLITPDLEEYDEFFLEKLKNYLKAGVKLIQFRSHSSGSGKIQELLPELVSLCNQYRCKLILNGTPEQALAVGAHGVHLTSARLLALTARPLHKKFYVGASCHNQQELEHAHVINADFAVLGPVKDTTSHPGAKPMGWDSYSGLTRKARLPVYALGGMGFPDLAVVRSYGGQGIAMISAVWEDDNSSSAIKRIGKN